MELPVFFSSLKVPFKFRGYYSITPPRNTKENPLSNWKGNQMKSQQFWPKSGQQSQDSNLPSLLPSLAFKLSHMLVVFLITTNFLVVSSLWERRLAESPTARAQRASICASSTGTLPVVYNKSPGCLSVSTLTCKLHRDIGQLCLAHLCISRT